MSALQKQVTILKDYYNMNKENTNGNLIISLRYCKKEKKKELVT